MSFRSFKEAAGISIADYIRRARLSEAARKLKEEQKKVLDVALEAGYDSPDGFQRAFFTEFGCNPLEYEKSDISILSYVPYDIKYRSKDLYKAESGRLDKIQVDNGKVFDFGKTAEYYGRFRDIYPQSLFEKLYSLGIGKAGTKWLDLGTGTGVFPRNLYQYGADITATDISEDQLEIARNLSLGMNNIHYEKVAAEEEKSIHPGMGQQVHLKIYAATILKILSLKLSLQKSHLPAKAGMDECLQAVE